MLATHLFIKRFVEKLEMINKPWCNVLSIQPQLLLLLDGSRLHLDSLKSMWMVQFPGTVQILIYCCLSKWVRWTYGSSAVIIEGLTDPEILKPIVCHEGLALAADLSLTHIKIATNCKSLVTDFSKGSNGNNTTITKEIQHRIMAFNYCSWVHKGRLSNVEAHSLAKHALSLSHGRHVWFLSPHDPIVIPVKLLFSNKVSMFTPKNPTLCLDLEMSPGSSKA